MSARTRSFECAFPRHGVIAVAELLAADAPATCQAFWDRLPIETDSYHTKWNGGELFAVLPPFPARTAESLTSDVQTGDVVLFHLAASYRAAPAHLRAAGLGDYAELGFFYGPLVRAYGPAGPVLGTRIGRIVEGLASLAEVARTMRRTGFTAMVIRHPG
jgi:hypothetical protein